MAESIYSYIHKFPIIESKITNKGKVTEGPKHEQCDAFKSSNSGIFTDNGESFSPKCKQIAQYQKEIINESNSTKPALCKYINYWFYGTLRTEKQTNHSNLLNAFYNKVQNLKYCKTYQKRFEPAVYKEVSELYKMYKEFNNFKEKSLQQSNPTCEDLTECIDIYEKYLKECQNVYKDGLCKNVIHFKYEYDDHRKIENKCVEKMKELEALRTDLESIILLPFVLMTLITFILVYLYKFTSFRPWLRPRLPGGKNKANKLHRRIQELQETSEPGSRRYKLRYHSS